MPSCGSSPGTARLAPVLLYTSDDISSVKDSTALVLWSWLGMAPSTPDSELAQDPTVYDFHWVLSTNLNVDGSPILTAGRDSTVWRKEHSTLNSCNILLCDIWSVSIFLGMHEI